MVWTSLPIQGYAVAWTPETPFLFPAALIPQPEPPFIQVGCYCARSSTCITSVNFKLALWAGVTVSQFAEEETEDPKVYARKGDSAGSQPRRAGFRSQSFLSSPILRFLNPSVLEPSTP